MRNLPSDGDDTLTYRVLYATEVPVLCQHNMYPTRLNASTPLSLPSPRNAYVDY